MRKYKQKYENLPKTYFIKYILFDLLINAAQLAEGKVQISFTVASSFEKKL